MVTCCRAVLHGGTLASLIVLAGCAAATNVRRVATATPEPAYELRGERLSTLQAQAAVLCPAGHDVVQQAERRALPADDPQGAERWWHDAASRVHLVDRDRARLLVQCRPAAR